MHYLLLTEYFPASEQAEITGGVESRCFHLVKELARNKNHQFTVLCSHQLGQPRESKVFGATVIRCGPTISYSGKGNILKRFRVAYALYKIGKNMIKDRNIPSPSIVEGASFLTYPSAYFLGKRFKAKKVATWHETWTGEWIKNKGWVTGTFGELWERFSLYLKWDEVISVSNFTKKRLVERGVSESKIRIVHNGIALAEIKSISAQKESVPTICYFGRLNWQKNVDVLIKALAEVKTEIPEVQGKILGSGPALEELQKLACELKIENSLKFYGHIPNYKELLTEAKKCHLFVQPSSLEGFGITVIEAMALGLPGVLSDIPPFLEITKNGKGVEISPQKKHSELAKKILLLLKDKEQNKKLYFQKIKEGEELVKEYDWKNIARQGYTL